MLLLQFENSYETRHSTLILFGIARMKSAIFVSFYIVNEEKYYCKVNGLCLCLMKTNVLQKNDMQVNIWRDADTLIIVLF